MEDIEVLKGDSFNMRCDFEAEPQPTVSWMKDNRQSLSEKAQVDMTKDHFDQEETF